jgi:hypothetical protein
MRQRRRRRKSGHEDRTGTTMGDVDDEGSSKTTSKRKDAPRAGTTPRACQNRKTKH